jgi:hypothetical protein
MSGSPLAFVMPDQVAFHSPQPGDGYATQLTMSVWLCINDATHGGPAFVLQTDSGAEFQTTITINSSSVLVSTRTFNGSFDLPSGTVVAPAPVNVLFSIDTVAQTVLCYWNDVALTTTGFVMGGTIERDGWLISGQVGVSEFWLNTSYHGSAFIDFSVAGNRRLFINADLSPATPSAATQQYLHIEPGAAVGTFLDNLGTAGAWTVEGTGYPVIDTDCAAGGGGGGGVDLPATGLAASGIWLDFSDDRGRSFGNPIMQSLGGVGEYITSVQFQRLGMSRSRIFRVTWSIDSDVCLQGAWITADPASS